MTNLTREMGILIGGVILADGVFSSREKAAFKTEHLLSYRQGVLEIFQAMRDNSGKNRLKDALGYIATNSPFDSEPHTQFANILNAIISVTGPLSPKSEKLAQQIRRRLLSAEYETSGTSPTETRRQEQSECLAEAGVFFASIIEFESADYFHTSNTLHEALAPYLSGIHEWLECVDPTDKLNLLNNVFNRVMKEKISQLISGHLTQLIKLYELAEKKLSQESEIYRKHLTEALKIENSRSFNEAQECIARLLLPQPDTSQQYYKVHTLVINQYQAIDPQAPVCSCGLNMNWSQLDNNWCCWRCHPFGRGWLNGLIIGDSLDGSIDGELDFFF